MKVFSLSLISKVTGLLLHQRRSGEYDYWELFVNVSLMRIPDHVGLKVCAGSLLLLFLG